MYKYQKFLSVFFCVFLVICISCSPDAAEPEPEILSELPPPPPPPDGSRLEAYLGGDMISRVGQYVVLDGSGSTQGDGPAINWWEWMNHPDNPETPWLKNGNTDTTITVPFESEGLYKFILYVKNEKDETSNTDTVNVHVLKRNNFIFEDSNLEATARHALQNPSGELTINMLSTLTSLYGADLITNKIKTLKGAEHCINITYLGFVGESLTNINPIANLTKLTDIHLYENRILEDISALAGLTNLRKLWIFSNRIKDISALANCVLLEELSISDNQVEDISSLRNLKNLKKVRFGGNNVKDISVLSDLINLERAYFSACQIEIMPPLNKLTKLRVLSLDLNNEISDISGLSGALELRQLKLSHNAISDITVLENLHNLDTIHLEENNIVDISPLVRNPGLGPFDIVGLKGNPLSDESINVHIPALQSRGVDVTFQ